MVRSAAILLSLLLCHCCGGSVADQSNLFVRRSHDNDSPAKQESSALSIVTSDLHRELILPGFTDPVTQFCNNIEVEWNIPLFIPLDTGITCSCEGSIFPPSITTGCTTKLCLQTDIICIAPKLEVGFNLLNLFSLKLPLSAKICLGGISIVGVGVVEELCFDFFNPITGLFSGLFSSDAVSENNFSRCSVEADGQRCNTCELCTLGNGSTGVTFGCPGFESVGCTELFAEPLPTETKMAINVDAVVMPDIVSKSG
jgi:hypothetical protein